MRFSPVPAAAFVILTIFSNANHAIAGGGSAASAPAAFAPGHLFVASKNTSSIIEFDAAGQKVREIGAAGAIVAPRDASFGADGFLYIPSPGNNSIVVIDGDGNVIKTFSTAAFAPAPVSVAHGPSGHLYIASATAGAVVEVDSAGNKIRSFSTSLQSPAAIAVGPGGNLFVASSGNHKIIQFDTAGAKASEITAPLLQSPTSLAFSPDGRLYACSSGNGRILVFDAAGAMIQKFPATGAVSPRALIFGNNGHLYVSGAGSDNIIEFTAEGERIGGFGEGHGLAAPQGMAIAPHRFEVKLAGGLAALGAPVHHHKNTATLSVIPGSRTILLHFNDNFKDSNDVPSVFGDAVFAFHGFEAGDPAAKKRLIQGTQICYPANALGTASIVVELSGKIGEHGEYSPVAARGSFHRAGAAGVYQAQISGAKLLK